MHDILVVAVAMLAFFCIGLPFSLLLPSHQFSVRWALAPPLGLGLLAAATAVFYVHDILAPWITMAVLPIGGIAFSVALLAARPFAISRGTTAVVASAVALIAIICLAPAWIGGYRFRVFQGNVYDHMLYVGSAISYRVVDYADLVARSNADLPDPIFQMALWFVEWRGAVSMMLAAVAVLTHGSAVDCAYPYMVALQVNMLFAALFVFTNVLALGRWAAGICATALAVGFFEQYIFDINAMSQLAGQPLFLLLLGFSALALEKDRFGMGVAAIGRMIAMSAALIAGIFFLYPEPLTIYGPAIGVAVVFALRHRCSRQAIPVAALGVGGGIAVGLLMCAPLWSGTGAYVVRVLNQAAGETPDWWNYFQGYLFGREESYLAVIGGHSNSLSHLLDAWFSWPVEAAVAALGLFAFLPTSGWPVALAIVWKLVLYGFIVTLLMNVVAAIRWAWRVEPEMPRTFFFLGSIVGCLVPLGILATGHGWAAGKGLAMAAPMLFALAISPLVTGPRDLTGLASGLVVLGHLCLGLARPFLVAVHALPGLPTASAHVDMQKASLDWDYHRIGSEIGTCKGLVIETSNPMMDNLLRRLAVESRTPWAAPKTMNWGSKSGQDHFPPGWEQFDCVASAGRLSAADGKRLVDLATDHTARDFVSGRRDDLELGVKAPSGVMTTGLYGLEKTPGGDLQWAGPKAMFELPNRPLPARSLQFQIWPMPLSGDRISIRINGREIFSGSPPQSLLTRSLDEFAGDDTLRLEIETNAPTRFPRDPRELGFAIRELSLHR